MESIALFFIAAFISYHLTAYVTARALKRRSISNRAQVQTGGDYSAARQLTAAADDVTRRLNDHPAHVGTGRRNRTRNGGPFRAHTDCPACGAYTAHPIRPPRPEAPRTIGTGNEVTLSTANGPAHTYIDSHPDRWDERPYEIVRTCHDPDCGWEWGHTANPTRSEETP